MSLKSKGSAAQTGRRGHKSNRIAATLFLAPALLVLAIFMLYPIVYTVMRSFFDAQNQFVGFENYRRIVTEPRMLIAVRNNALWVAIVPAIITSFGLIFAVLVEKIRWSTAFKAVLFMPLVVSGLAAGVTFRFIYAGDANLGLANAVSQSIVHVFSPPGQYPGARLSTQDFARAQDGTMTSINPVSTGEKANFGLAAIRPQMIPDDAQEVRSPNPPASGISGAVWLDFLPGGKGTRGVPDPGKRGLPGIRLEALKGDKVVATTYTDVDGSYTFNNLDEGSYYIRLSESNFREPFGGFYWLGQNLIVPSVMLAYIWINTGFALIIIGAGLASINRDFLEAARVEGANEWHVFRYITVPVLTPVLMVVFVRAVIAVLKVFDIVLVIAPESVQGDATVLALEMWNAAFGGMRDFGLGSALATILFLLIVPVMLSNVRRFRLEQAE